MLLKVVVEFPIKLFSFFVEVGQDKNFLFFFDYIFDNLEEGLFVQHHDVGQSKPVERVFVLFSFDDDQRILFLNMLKELLELGFMAAVPVALFFIRDWPCAHSLYRLFLRKSLMMVLWSKTSFGILSGGNAFAVLASSPPFRIPFSVAVKTTATA